MDLYEARNRNEPITTRSAPPASGPEITEWCKGYFDALRPYAMGGGYVNFMMEEGQDRVKAAYKDNYERLAEVKSKYDPTNFLHLYQNVKPE